MGAFFLPALLVVLVIAIGAIEPRFYNRLNLQNVVGNASFLMGVGAGQALVIISGGFDLSVGAVVALASSLGSRMMVYAAADLGPGVAILLGILVGLGAGGLVGLVNGLAVAVLDVSPFMVTLGTMSIVGGIAFLVTAGAPVYGLPDAFTTSFGQSRPFGLPSTVWVDLLAIAVLIFVQRRARFGRHLYAIGGDRHAAWVSGVPTARYLTYAYVICGVMAAVTGLLLTARIGSGQANLGTELTLQSVAVAIIGGVSLRGGVGRIESVVVSSLFVAVVGNGMNLVRIGSKYQVIVLGAVLIFAVGIDELSRRMGRRG
jgi:ribose transport system permease protein